MKNQYLLLSLCAIATTVSITAEYVEHSQAQREAYFQKKINRGDRQETPQFRFALKYLKHLHKYLDNSLSHEEFMFILKNKIRTYKDNIQRSYQRSALNLQDNEFLVTCLTSTVDQLEEMVGTREKEGTLERYIPLNQPQKDKSAQPSKSQRGKSAHKHYTSKRDAMNKNKSK